MMKNFWLTNKIVAKGIDFWTFEILDEKQRTMVAETIIAIDEKPQLMVVEKCEVVENGEKIWKPVCMVWEKFEATYTDEKFLDTKQNHIRLLEVNGDAVGILRLYDKSGEHVESWVMHGLKLNDFDWLECQGPPHIKAVFTFHHALYCS